MATKRRRATFGEDVRRQAAAQAREGQNPTKPKELQVFPSLQSMMEYANGPCDLAEGNQSSHRKAMGGFNDFPDWESAMQAGRAGWPEGTKNIKALSASLTDKVLAQVRVPDLAYHDEGSYLNSERYREGDPECLMRWEESEEVMQGQGEIRILINVCCSGAVDSAVLQARGAAVIALTQAIELVGKQVQLDVVANTADAFETRFTAKLLEEPIQLDQLAFSAGSADMFRRFMFACWERAKDKGVRDAAGCRGYGGRYGFPRNAHFVEGYDLVLPTMIGYGAWDEFADPKRAEKWVLSKLEELGVELEGGAR